MGETACIVGGDPPDAAHDHALVGRLAPTVASAVAYKVRLGAVGCTRTPKPVMSWSRTPFRGLKGRVISTCTRWGTRCLYSNRLRFAYGVEDG